MADSVDPEDTDDRLPRSRPRRIALGLALLLALAAVGALTLVTFQNSDDLPAAGAPTAATSPAMPTSPGAESASTSPEPSPSASTPTPGEVAPSIIPLSAGPAGTAAAAYPPVTLLDLQAFGATGSDSDVVKYAYEQAGTARCLDPVVRATVAPSLTGQVLAASAVAYFLSHGLDTQPCKATLVLYYGASTDQGQAFTAGRVSLGQNADQQRFVKVEVGDSATPTILFTVNIGPIAP